MLTLWRKKDAIQIYLFHYLGPVYMEKSCPGQEVDPPSRVNFSEHLYEKRSSPLCGGQELPTGDNFSLYQRGFTNLLATKFGEKSKSSKWFLAF